MTQPAYKLAETPEDYALCYELMKSEVVQPDDVELKNPTIMALSEGKLVAFLGSYDHEDMVIAGPMVLKEKSILIAWMMCELYQIAMRQFGAESFIMAVDDGNIMDQAIKRYNPPGIREYSRSGTTTFYIRELRYG